VDLSTIDVPKIAVSVLGSLGSTLAAHTKGFVVNAVGTVVTLVVMLVTMTVLFHEGPALLALTRQFLPVGDGEKEEVFRRLRDVTRAVFFGVILTALAQAVVGAIGIAIVGLPSVMAFGAAMFFAAVLPAGTAIVWVPAAAWLLLSGHPFKALFLALWGGLAVGTIDNFLRPIFIGKGVQMSTLLVFFGIFGGMLSFGLVGIFLGPLVITLFLFLLDVLKRNWFRDGTVG
jgi:predicted PurR-regulated permease PerM